MWLFMINTMNTQVFMIYTMNTGVYDKYHEYNCLERWWSGAGEDDDGADGRHARPWV